MTLEQHAPEGREEKLTKNASHQDTDSVQETAVSVLVVEDDTFALQNILTTLKRKGYAVEGYTTAPKALKVLETKQFQVIVSDVKLPVMDGLEFIGECQKREVGSKYIIVTGYADESSVIRALRLGVDDFLKKPYREGELLHAVGKAVKMQRLEEENRRYKERLQVENTILHRELNKRIAVETSGLVGTSQPLKKCLATADKVGKHSINALIRGESGTGKEVMAQYIRQNGARSTKPFVAVNCAALSPSLFESELFGYEKGAFTGATEARAGLFEAANGGIMFLDELTEIPLTLQAKLLRVVESQVVRRVGGAEARPIDVQILCSTNRNIAEAIEGGFLRLDLYHRLAAVEIVLPPLRERTEDFEALTAHFIALYEQQLGLQAVPIPPTIMNFLKEQPWEGNIRQLSNIMKRWCLFGEHSDGNDVAVWLSQTSLAESSLAENSLAGGSSRGGSKTSPNGVNSSLSASDAFLHGVFTKGTFEELNDIKERLIREVLKKYHGNKTKAAQHLGISYPGLLKMLKAMNGGNAEESLE